jgi:hypothetical protein
MAISSVLVVIGRSQRNWRRRDVHPRCPPGVADVLPGVLGRRHLVVSMTDEERERLIEHYRQILTHDPERHAKKFAQLRMAHLISGRSVAQIAKMEVERGLRA